MEPLEVLFEADGVAADRRCRTSSRSSTAARSASRHADAVRELRRDDRRRRRDPVDPELECARRRGQRGGSLRHGPLAGVRRRRPHRRGDAGEPRLKAPGDPTRCTRRAPRHLRSCAAALGKDRAAGGRDPHRARFDRSIPPRARDPERSCSRARRGRSGCASELPEASTIVVLGDEHGARPTSARRGSARTRTRAHPQRGRAAHVRRPRRRRASSTSSSSPSRPSSRATADTRTRFGLARVRRAHAARSPRAASRRPPTRRLPLPALRGRARDRPVARGERRGARYAARAVLRPRLRLRVHAGHGADQRRPDLGGTRERPRRARRPLVGVGRVRLADEHRRCRRGRGPSRRLRRDDGDARRVARRAGRVRQTTRSSSPAPTRSSGSRIWRCTRRGPRRSRPPRGRRSALGAGSLVGDRASSSSPPRSTARRRPRCGRSRSPATSRGR